MGIEFFWYPTRVSLLFAALLGALLTRAVADDPCAQASPEAMAAALGIELPGRPWHMANIFWRLESEVERFESLTQTVHIDRDIPESYNLYIAPIGSGKINGLMFYGGLQTNINGWPDKASRKRVQLGRGAIFSRWSEDQKTPLSLDHVRMADPECLVESAGYEGEFASVRRPIPWTKGLWTYQIRKHETELVEGKPHTWFECRVKSPEGKWTPVGQLRFEGDSFTFAPLLSTFVEVYQTATIPKSGIPKVELSFGWPMFNGKEARIKSVNGYHPVTNIQASPDCATIEAKGDKVLVKVAEIFKRDPKQRNFWLNLKRD